ncbi:MAG: hypothetical protein WCP69_06720 [Bacteroidota bacterium]
MRENTPKALIFNTSPFRAGAKSVENLYTKQVFWLGKMKISRIKNIFNKADEKLNLFAHPSRLCGINFGSK